MEFFSTRCRFTPSERPLVIAEIGVNHNGSLDLARRLVDAAAEAGAQVAKFQVFRTESEISRFAELAPYQKVTAPNSQSQYDLCKPLELPPGAFRTLKSHCADRGIGFFASVFDFDSADLVVDELCARAVKIASGEVTNWPLLEHVAAKKASVMLSTGACRLAEVEAAVDVLRRAGSPEIVVLHCVSNYPAPMADLNLRVMATLRDALALPIGFSDHSAGTAAAIAATALGAVAIEKHFTLDRNMEGPDHASSSEPQEMRELVRSVHDIWQALGDGVKRPMPSEEQNLPLIRRSLVADGPLRRGVRLSREMIGIKRPAGGIEPFRLAEALGRELRRDLQADEPITWGDLN